MLHEPPQTQWLETLSICTADKCAGQWCLLVPAVLTPMSDRQLHWAIPGWLLWDDWSHMNSLHVLSSGNYHGRCRDWGTENQERPQKHSMCFWELFWAFPLPKPVTQLSSDGRWGNELHPHAEGSAKSCSKEQRYKEGRNWGSVGSIHHKSQWWRQWNVWTFAVCRALV